MDISWQWMANKIMQIWQFDIRRQLNIGKAIIYVCGSDLHVKINTRKFWTHQKQNKNVHFDYGVF